jgi:hypothetical protein
MITRKSAGLEGSVEADNVRSGMKGRCGSGRGQDRERAFEFALTLAGVSIVVGNIQLSVPGEEGPT